MGIGFNFRRELQQTVEHFAWVQCIIAHDEITCDSCPLKRVLGTVGQKSTPLSVWPTRVKLGTVAERAIDKSLDIFVNNILWDDRELCELLVDNM